MAYYKDLSPYEYRVKASKPSILNIGWLDRKHTLSIGMVSENFLERLWLFCQRSVREARGYHSCEFCETPIQPLLARHGSKELELGAAEIWVPGQDGIVYAAPNLIYHYVTAHNYKPPDAFINAVLSAPLPTTLEYFAFLDQLDVDYLFLDDEGNIIAAGGASRYLLDNKEFQAMVKSSFNRRL